MAGITEEPNPTSDYAVPPDSGGVGRSIAHSSSLRPSHDSTSDNEASEGPVREKLKKTSIAAMPKESNTHTTANAEEGHIQSQQGGLPRSDPTTTSELPDPNAQDRGRLLRKRSFDDTAANVGPQDIADGIAPPIYEGRERKRSKDVHAGRLPRIDTHEQGPIRSPVVEEVDIEGGPYMCSQSALKDLSNNDSSMAGKQTAPGEDTTDQEMKDHPFSPRKKRSRDPLDTDPHREQKIVATEEARAHRRSDEYERGENLPEIAKSEHLNGSVKEGSAWEEAGYLPTKENSRTSGFTDTSVTSPFTALSSSKSPLEAPTVSANETSDPIPRTSSAAFASSGFAALSQSSASPFGSLAPSSKGNASTFGSAAASNSPQNKSSADRGVVTSSNRLGGPQMPPSTSSEFGVMAPSPFVSIGIAPKGPFGGSTFGSNIGGDSFGRKKLSSFAAPGADTTWGGTGHIKPLGTSVAKKSDDETSGSDGEGDASVEPDLEEDKPDGRFQQQDLDTGEEGEESIFTANRANLYAFEGSWKERGRGVFKLNVATTDADESGKSQKKGRFIMRAHQTYRILLNTPVFKQMKVGDTIGQEPSGKQVSLAVIESGKPTPYLIKLSDNSEAKSLYQEVRKLQQAM